MEIVVTKKEAVLLNDLLTLEENACKKFRLYSRILTNFDLAQNLKELANNHENRLKKLLELL